MEPVQAEAIDIEALYTQYGKLVLRRIRRFYPPQVAADVLQEVFERVLIRAPSFRGEGSPRAWLFGLTTRHCLARLRNERRRRHLLEELGEVPWSLPISESDTEARVFLQQLWHTLDPELVQIGIHHYVDGMTQAAIGDLMGVTGRTISNRLQQLQRLARQAAVPAGGDP